MKTKNPAQQTIDRINASHAFNQKALAVLTPGFTRFLARHQAAVRAELSDRCLEIRERSYDQSKNLDRKAWDAIKRRLIKDHGKTILDTSAIENPKRTYPTGRLLLGFIPFLGDDTTGRRESRNGIQIWFSEPLEIRRSECTILYRKLKEYTRFNIFSHGVRLGRKEGVRLWKRPTPDTRTNEEIRAWAEQILWTELTQSKQEHWNLIDDKPNV